MATTFYRLFLWLYRCGAIVLSPFNEKASRWLSGRKNIFANLQASIDTKKRKPIWFHCASLGEFEQARPLLEIIRKQYPGHYILLSFFSPSGYEVRKDYKGADCVTYLPLDSAGNAKKMLDIIQPGLVIWVKYEYWHFYLQQIKQRHIPLLLVSGIFRSDQPFFKFWGNFHRNMLNCFTYLFVQNQDSKKLLGSIGFSDNVTVSGDTRFDRVIEIADEAKSIPIIEQFINGSSVIVAGSTWEEDEEELDHFANTHPEIKFIIAPHETDEAHLKEIEKLFHHTIRYSKLLAGHAQIQARAFGTIPGNRDHAEPLEQNVLIIDNIGMLAQLYRYATIAYVGGGFGNDGVHNVLEAAVYSKPVIFGPVYEKFAEAVQLIDAGGAFSIENALELEENLLILLKNGNEYKVASRAAGAYVYANKGATQKILDYIQEKRLLTN
ncbi:MAG: glycosyltransferase N-terminal domain-containing protein [Bacteroidota bacterium]